MTDLSKRKKTQCVAAADSESMFQTARAFLAPILEKHALNIDDLLFTFYYCPRLRRVLEFCVRGVGAKITLAQVASVANLTPSYFSRYFRSRTGWQFSRWISALRIGHSVLMLRSEDCGIPVVSRNSGFASVRSFERHFRRWMGCTAAQYKAYVIRDRTMLLSTSETFVDRW